MGKNFPIFLFVFGVAMAVVGAAKTGDAIGVWPDTTWVFLVGSIISTVGIVFWHEDRRLERVAARASANPDAAGDPEALLKGLVGPLNAFGEKINTMGADDSTKRPTLARGKSMQ